MKGKECKAAGIRGWVVLMSGLWLLASGCTTWDHSFEEAPGQSHVYEAEWYEVFEAIREEIEERDFRVRYAEADQGRLTALSGLRGREDFFGSRQTELVFSLGEVPPGRVELTLRIVDIEERQVLHDQPVATRKTLRTSPLYAAIFDSIGERLGERGQPDS